MKETRQDLSKSDAVNLPPIYMSRTLLENAPKNRPILKIKDHHLFSPSLPFPARRRRDSPYIRRESAREKERKKDRERERICRVAAGVRLIVVSNRLYSGILIRSQLRARL